ncbi:hypothetical protein GOP47_0007263 [Adiantum capillus-veneris]|uniref:PDZ domain-containing protein n=1 Tax=Adiantum capillus-veneris TaxID=13818 RepID=A0A9D4ZJ51_ADICA|nr:hypothetical protein GOP47_0007263 [Adiantum capillus-veneris]
MAASLCLCPFPRLECSNADYSLSPPSFTASAAQNSVYTTFRPCQLSYLSTQRIEVMAKDELNCSYSLEKSSSSSSTSAQCSSSWEDLSLGGREEVSVLPHACLQELKAAAASCLDEFPCKLAELWSAGERGLSTASVWLASVVVAFALMTTITADCHAFVVTPSRKLQGDELATVQLFQENTPSVVYITNLAARRDAFTLDIMEVPQGSGSGFIWDTDGHIVTNYHVIRGASDLRVTLGDQSTYEAKVVGFDRDKDVAVLHIDSPKNKLRPIPVGSSTDLLVGQKVYAIGNPFGLDHTLTTGVISGLRREISSAATGRPIQDVIQTDAAINPGNSGGPLLDSSGTLIGINTAIYSPSGASAGVGFSIPVDTVRGIVEQLVKYGKVTRPILGITFAPEQSVEQLGVSGVLVLDAPPMGPAGKAGLKPTTRDSYGRLVLGDIITSINGEKVKNGSDLYRILDRCKVGDEVAVEVLRGNKTEKFMVTLESRTD